MSVRLTILCMVRHLKRKIRLILEEESYLISIPVQEENPVPIMDKANVAYQTAELGKVDFGGGGTIAFIAALYGMEVIDSGVAVLSMHAPWEVTSKADIYEARKCYQAFLKNA